MSRRILAPLLLFTAALGSMAAVFAVHGIESAGGPLAEPFVSSTVSPGLPPKQGGVAVIRFTARQPEHVTVKILDARGAVRSTPLRDKHVRRMEVFAWDGTDDRHRPLPDGTYHVHITRAGDERVYTPHNTVRVDTRPPAAKLDAIRRVGGQLRGLVIMARSDAVLAAFDEHGERIRSLRATPPAADTVTVTPRDRWPAGTRLVRFALQLEGRDPGDVRLAVVDAAGNRTELDR